MAITHDTLLMTHDGFFMKQGLFITLEGIEGSGKSTQLKQLGFWLQNQGFEAIVTREPGGTEIGNNIRSILINPEYKNMEARTELLLYAASRHQHLKEVIEPALKAHKIVLCDRFSDSTRAYQGGARNLNNKLVEEIIQLATAGREPHLSFLLDCEVKTALERARSRNSSEGVQDRFDDEELAFHVRVKESFLELAQKNPERICIINGDQDPKKVSEDIINNMKDYLSKHM